MRTLLKILAGGTAVFMGLAIAQEWRSFDEAWFASAPSPTGPSERERKEASDRLYEALKLMEHLYSSGGDPRFADRMPVADRVLEEIRSDLDYLRQNQRRQEMSLDRLEVVDIRAVDPDRLEIQTREIWSSRVTWLAGGGPAEPEARRLVHATYRLSRGTRGWRVDDWDPCEPWRESSPSPGAADR